MPSITPVITKEESSTATARKPRFLFRGIAEFAEKKRHHQRDQRAWLGLAAYRASLHFNSGLLLTRIELYRLGGATCAASTASKWEYRTPHFPSSQKKSKAGFELSVPAGLAGGRAFFLRTRRCREIKNEVFWQLRCCFLRW